MTLKIDLDLSSIVLYKNSEILTIAFSTFCHWFAELRLLALTSFFSCSFPNVFVSKTSLRIAMIFKQTLRLCIVQAQSCTRTDITDRNHSLKCEWLFLSSLYFSAFSKTSKMYWYYFYTSKSKCYYKPLIYYLHICNLQSLKP